jgi:predicted component of type VI protein secretion system
MRFRLRYLHHDLELSEGEFAVGRSASCQLSLDDPLVSRRHAVLVVSAETVTVEDLGSRNGVVVNGQKITGKTQLAPGDKITIGSQELTLFLGREVAFKEANAALAFGKRTLPSMPAVSEMAKPSSSPPDSEADIEPSMVRRADAFGLLGSVAEKAMAMGRSDEAERLLAGPLADVVEASRAGRKLPVSVVDLASRLAAKLATATGKGAWADYVIELYSAQQRPAPAPVVDELYSALRKVNAIDLARLRDYVGKLREKQGSLGPAERFLLQRIEGLERLAALR